MTTARTTTRSTIKQSEAHHATIVQLNTEQRLKIKNRSTHLGITIRRDGEPLQTGQHELIKEASTAERQSEVPRC